MKTNNNIQPQYVNFEQAKWLKEKNFNVKTLYCYLPGGDTQYSICGGDYSKPEQYKVIEWLRLNYDLWIPYQESLELQKLGFNEPCLAWYNYDKLHIFGYDNLLDSYSGEENRPLAPLYQQFFKWTRDKYHIHYYIEAETDEGYEAGIDRSSISFSYTYEESELLLVKEIIGIIKQRYEKQHNNS